MHPSLATPELFVRGNSSHLISHSLDLERLITLSPLEHYRFCRALLNLKTAVGPDPTAVFWLNGARHSIRASETSLGFEAAIRCPSAHSYQPSIAALALLARILGKPEPEPIAPKLFPSNAPIGDIAAIRQGYRLLPIPIARELVKLWEEWGHLEADEKIMERVDAARRWLALIGNHSEQLFTRENEFDETEGFDQKMEESESGIDAFLGAARLSAPPLHACLTLSGWNTGLGVIKLGDVDIPSFGPQRFPLSDLSGFGITQISSHSSSLQAGSGSVSLNGWTRCYADPEIWLSLNAIAQRQSISLTIRWSGIEPGPISEKTITAPYAMVFYVRASHCTLEDGTVLYPQSLRRYEGKGRKMIFDQQAAIECSETLNVQVIPLAGFGCFWNATFLVSFEFSPCQNRASFILKHSHS